MRPDRPQRAGGRSASLIIGGRQSAYEWAALVGEHGAARVDVVHRHDDARASSARTGRFVDPLVELTRAAQGLVARARAGRARRDRPPLLGGRPARARGLAGAAARPTSTRTPAPRSSRRRRAGSSSPTARRSPRTASSTPPATSPRWSASPTCPRWRRATASRCSTTRWGRASPASTCRASPRRRTSGRSSASSRARRPPPSSSSATSWRALV